jgi:hypothetical protein
MKLYPDNQTKIHWSSYQASAKGGTVDKPTTAATVQN